MAGGRLAAAFPFRFLAFKFYPFTSQSGRWIVFPPARTRIEGHPGVAVRISGPLAVTRIVSSDFVPQIEGFHAMTCPARIILFRGVSGFTVYSLSI